MRPLHVLAAIALVAAAPAVRAQGEVRAVVPQTRYFVRATGELFPTRAELLMRVRTVVLSRGDPAALDTRIAELEQAGRPTFQAVRTAVEDLGGRVLLRPVLSAGTLVELPVGAAESLRARAGIAEVVAEQQRGSHIGTATNANNHAADVVQSGSPGCRGRGATLALLDSGIDLACSTTGSVHPAFFDPPHGDAMRVRAAFGLAAPDDLEDLTGHGTAVAGIAVARKWDGTAATDDGFAPEASVVSLKITRGSGTTYTDGDLVAALDVIARERLRLGLGIANLSWAGVPSPNHFTQRALDELAFFFDVVIVISAGNDGDLPNPTARSHGCANALAVAAVHPDTHTVWERSTYGPLLGDPERLWPDLAAVGVGLRTPWPDQPTGVGPPQTGTSFAAPAVSGTALMLRGEEPSLSALETRALLLGSAADVSAANPGLGRIHFGLGLLRSDLAVEALRTGSRYRGTLTTANPDFEVSIEPGAGRTMVATLTWDRTDVFRPDWDDLDLEVLAPDGRVVAVSDTLRNLYERVVFVAAQPGSYRLAVRGRRLTSLTLDFALVVHEGHGGARQPGGYATSGSGCAGLGVDPAQGTELPAFAAGRFGTAKMELPLAGAPGRLLQILDGSSLPPDLTIRAIGLRRDESSLGAPGWRVDLRVRMGHTSRAPTSPLATFDANFDIAGDISPVLDARSLDVPGVSGLPPDASMWDFVLPLDRPFVPQVASGNNVVVDFQLLGHSRNDASFGLFLDAELDLRTASVTARGDPFAATGVADPVGLVLSLIDDRTFAVVPRIDADRMPQLGETMQVVLRGAPPRAVAALVHGASNADWGPHPLPLDLAWLGAPGCALMVRPDVLLPVTVGANGQAAVGVAIPGVTSWTGAVFHQQFFVLDPAANALGLSTSPGTTARVGM